MAKRQGRGRFLFWGYTHVKPHIHLSSHADCGFGPWGIDPKVSPTAIDKIKD